MVVEINLFKVYQEGYDICTTNFRFVIFICCICFIICNIYYICISIYFPIGQFTLWMSLGQLSHWSVVCWSVVSLVSCLIGQLSLGQLSFGQLSFGQL